MSTLLRRLSRHAGALSLSFVGALALAACNDATAPATVRHLTPEVALCCGGVPTWTPVELAYPAGNWSSSRASAINDSNLVVGHVMDLTGFKRPVRWANGVPTLAVLPLSDYSTEVFGVNNAGEMVGAGRLQTATMTGSMKPVRWSQVAMILPTLGFDGSALDINMSHVAVGESRASGASKRHAVKWTAGGAIVDLHPAGASSSVAYGVNDQGDIAGTVDFADGAHGWVWKANGTHLDLGVTARSNANDINNLGETVGAIVTPSGFLANVWTPNGTALQPFGVTAPSLGMANSEAHRIVGFSGPAAMAAPFTTRSSTFTALALLPNWASATPYGVNRCGHVAGTANTTSGPRAVRWLHSSCDP